MADQARVAVGELPLGPVESRGIGRDAMLMLIISEGALFAYLLFSYYYTAATAPPGWVLEHHPSLVLALPNTVLLIGSSVAAIFAERAVRREQRGRAVVALGIAVMAGIVFVLVQLYEWSLKTYTLQTSSYSSLYFVTTGAHLAHVVIGLLILIAILGWTAAGFFSAERSIVVSTGILYWHFVDAVWLCVFATYYLTPYLRFPS